MLAHLALSNSDWLRVKPSHRATIPAGSLGVDARSPMFCCLSHHWIGMHITNSVVSAFVNL